MGGAPQRRPSKLDAERTDDARFAYVGQGRHNLAHPASESRHLEQREGHAIGFELLKPPSVELAACGNNPHFVIQVGPRPGAAPMAKADELGDLGWRSGGRVGVRRALPGSVENRVSGIDLDHGEEATR